MYKSTRGGGGVRHKCLHTHTPHTPPHTHTHSNTHTHTHTDTDTHTLRHTHTHTRTHTRARARTHAHTTCCDNPKPRQELQICSGIFMRPGTCYRQGLFDARNRVHRKLLAYLIVGGYVPGAGIDCDAGRTSPD